ncbi:MAG: 1-phosphofructokinase family hexose kinase [Mycoplasmataceae bacterium]|nr:1-phosphofructokinase family hexose kinase [Mycoplasmataceae bacterium]
MFYTITFSPAIDLLIETEQQFDRNGLTRYDNSSLFPGGKGINASIVMKRLGFETTAITFMKGTMTKIIERGLEDEKIKLISIPSENNIRINVQFNNQVNTFELNGPASIISKSSEEKLLKLIKEFNKDDVVFIMGKSDMVFVEKIVRELSALNIKFVLDIDSKEVLNLLKYKPFAIKPNLIELQTLMNTKIKNDKDIIKSGKELIKLGLKNLLVSCAGNGSFFINKDVVLKIETPVLKIINSSGAGDSMLATFVANYINTNDIEKSFILGNAAGMATVHSKWLASNEMIQHFKNDLKIIRIKE